MLIFINKLWVRTLLFLLLNGVVTGACCSDEARGENLVSSQQAVDPEVLTTGIADVAAEVEPANVDRISNKVLGEYRTIEWTDLMPKDDLDAMMNPPSYLDDIIDGSIEDQINSQVQSAIAAANDNGYQQALVSTRVVVAFNNQAIRIPGFIVPLEFDGAQTITRFFIVPYFGACIHVPPPPPNQIIYAAYPKGFKLEALYDPFWITGVLKTTLTGNDMGTSAYSITVDSIQSYVL